MVCISDYARSQLMALSEPETWEKLHVIHVGIPVEQFTRSTAALRRAAPEILCIGRLVPEKGQAVLIEALAPLTERGHAVDADVRRRRAGAPALERLAERPRNRVEGLLPGRGGPGRDPRPLRSASIFCLPSFAEGIPVVLMEAMAMRIPVSAPGSPASPS